MDGLGVLDITVIVVYLIGIIIYGISKAKRSSSEDYFLGGRTMTWPIVGIALFSANISSSTLVGLASDAFQTDVSVYNYEWYAVVILIFFALTLLKISYLKITGALLLIWIGIKLLQPEPENNEHTIGASSTLLGAIKTIIIADAVMSLDNVIAIAGAAKDSIGLVIFGLLISVPIIVWSSKLVIKLMDRFPVIITIGAGLLGWIAGDMVISDTVTKEWVNTNAAFMHWLSPICGVLVIILIGKWLAAKTLRKKLPLVDLADDTDKPLGPPQT